ncbi:MAG: hypothetical protein H6579_00930 [Chitinophagales bacterium]|nr:hypothetical protein [Chitinophagales bacterium]
MSCREFALFLNPEMRILAFILCIYIATLSVVPCTDYVPQTTHSSNTEVSTGDHDHNHSDHQDSCTPFCVCACCGTMITMPTLQPLVQARVVISTDYLFYYTLDYSFDYNEGVWHPPAHS